MALRVASILSRRSRVESALAAGLSLEHLPQHSPFLHLPQQSPFSQTLASHLPQQSPSLQLSQWDLVQASAAASFWHLPQQSPALQSLSHLSPHFSAHSFASHLPHLEQSCFF
ncbi:MAG: hypothetical protein AAGC74_04245 [Verrucomicrobiota bacterium]